MQSFGVSFLIKNHYNSSNSTLSKLLIYLINDVTIRYPCYNVYLVNDVTVHYPNKYSTVKGEILCPIWGMYLSAI